MLPVWNSVLKIKPNNSRRSSASSAKSLGWKVPGFVYLKMFGVLVFFLTYTYIPTSVELKNLYPYIILNWRLQTTAVLIWDCLLVQLPCHKKQNVSQMWFWRANTPSHNHQYALIFLFPKAATAVFYLINTLPLLCYYWNLPISIWL